MLVQTNADQALINVEAEIPVADAQDFMSPVEPPLCILRLRRDLFQCLDYLLQIVPKVLEVWYASAYTDETLNATFLNRIGPNGLCFFQHLFDRVVEAGGAINKGLPADLDGIEEGGGC